MADMFGARNVGAVHGVILTAWSAAGVAGPILITRIREANVEALPPGSSLVHIYDLTMYLIAGLLCVGLVLAAAVRPLQPARREA
ncbi:MAG: hypothetical protein JNL82_14710 [Myxococcales bacterium]|nr:hypothetical protein [Myxococcales bacterium]